MWTGLEAALPVGGESVNSLRLTVCGRGVKGPFTIKEQHVVINPMEGKAQKKGQLKNSRQSLR